MSTVRLCRGCRRRRKSSLKKDLMSLTLIDEQESMDKSSSSSLRVVVSHTRHWDNTRSWRWYEWFIFYNIFDDPKYSVYQITLLYCVLKIAEIILVGSMQLYCIWCSIQTLILHNYTTYLYFVRKKKRLSKMISRNFKQISNGRSLWQLNWNYSRL